MTDSNIRPGALVRDSRSRVGKVVGNTENVVINDSTVAVVAVDFWGDQQRRPERSLTPLDDKSPEAVLWERPSELAKWADDAPLKLVALALSVSGGSGRVADIREKLDDRVPGIKWDGWWRKAPAQMRLLPQHFSVTRVGKDSEYKLLSSVDAVPAATDVKDTDKKSPTATDWKNWLQADTHSPAPGRFPTKATLDALALWPAPTVERALLRVIVSAEEALASRGINPQAAEAWLRAVAQASLRWREVDGNDPRGYTAARVGEVVARLARVAGDRAPQDLVLQAGAIDGVTDAWRRGFLAGMWESFEGEDVRAMYLEATAVLGRQARGDLAREIALAAFGPEIPDRRHADLDRLLDALSESERMQTLEEIIARASAAQKAGVQEFIASSRHASGRDRLGIRLKGVLTVSSPEDKFAQRTSEELAAALDEPQKYGEDVQTVLGALSGKVVEARSSASAEVRKRSEEAQSNIEAERQEQERLRQQVRERNAELAANREESRLEVREDMLLFSGELLQAASQWTTLEEAKRDALAGLALTLRAGGAEPLEKEGNIVDYDPGKHQADAATHEGCRVKVLAPGVIYHGGNLGDRVLLKARVTHEVG